MKILSPIELNIVTYTASTTLAKIDGGKLILMNGATTNNVTVPANGSVNFPIGTQIVIIQKSAIQTTFVADAGVTINSANSILNILNRYGNAILVKTATNTWELSHEVDLSNLNASNLTSGTVPTARLGSGAVGSGLKYLADDSTWKTISAGGLTYFTEAQNSSVPNATVKVDSLTAIASTTDADFSILPKGAGAFQLAIPDNTATGGNKRGIYSVDLQIARASATQVASGTYSFIGGGYGNNSSGSGSVTLGVSNTASGQYGTSIGYANNNSGTYGALATGWSNLMSSTGGFVGGYGCNHSSNYGLTMGYSSSNSGNSTIVIGQSISASAAYSLVVGQSHNVTGGNNSVVGSGGVTINGFGRQVQAYYNTTVGDAQNTKMVLTKRTTDATLTPLTVGGAAPYFGQTEFSLQDNSCVRFKGTIVGKQTGSANIGVWDIDGVISKAGTVTINVNNVIVVTNASTWGTPTLSVNGTLGLSINVIGKVATNIQWTAYLDATEVVY
jgi:hypothetical protein